VTWSSSICYAQNSFDNALDTAYADGWQEGDNGGSGFEPWNFDSSYVTPGNPPSWHVYTNAEFHAIDDGLRDGTQYSNPHNNIGRAWAMGNKAGSDGVVRAGRGFSPLAIGDTFSMTFDNPTRRAFFNGYIIRLNGGTGGMNGNICNKSNGFSCTPNAPQPIEQIGLSRFEYFNYGEWNLYDAGGTQPTGVFDTVMTTGGTAAAGAVFSVTRTGANTYDVLLDPLGSAASFSASRTYQGLPIDWIEFVFFNPTTDTTPTLGEPGTDLYIRSLEIIRAAPPGQPGDFNDDGKVDAADYVMWRKHNGTNNALPNDDGLGTPIGTAHFNLWRANFGEMAGSGSGVGGGVVPEPGTFAMLAGLLAGWLPWRQRNRDNS
jgi:hypothetical protein